MEETNKNKNNQFIPFHVPAIGEEEIAEVVATLRQGWLTTGPRTAQFEKEFAAYVRAPHALAVNSCTAGLHLALAALGLGPGDEVITTPLTFCATVNTILHVGATPVLADIGEDGNIDPESIRRSINENTRAIVPVHLAGLPCRMNEIWQIAREHHLYVVEDAAHAAGTEYEGLPVGAGNPRLGYYSDAVAYSFYATKNLTTGEGGMVTTHNPALYDRMKILCLHGISKDAWSRYSEKGKWFYEVTAGGFKYNLSDIQSAIGIHQLRKLDRFTEERERIAGAYRAALGEVAEIELPPAPPAGARHAWHLYMIRLRLEELEIDRARFMDELREAGVGASVHFIPIPLHPYYAKIETLQAALCPAAMALYERIVSLPIFPGLTGEQIGRIAEAVKKIVERSRRPLLVKAVVG